MPMGYQGVILMFCSLQYIRNNKRWSANVVHWVGVGALNIDNFHNAVGLYIASNQNTLQKDSKILCFSSKDQPTMIGKRQ